MKQLILLFILSYLPAITSFAQDICPVCEDLIMQTNVIDSPQINTELIHILEDTLEVCKLSVDTNDISINISFIKNFFMTEDNLSACENDIANCKFFMADSEKTIAKYGIADSVMKNIEYPISGFDIIYILQKDQFNCRIFQLKVNPTEDDILFDIVVDGEKTICPGDNIELKVDFQEDSLNYDEYTYQWKKNDMVVGNDTILTVNSNGQYYFTTTSNINLCSSINSVNINYKDNYAIMYNDTIEIGDTIIACINDEVIVKARPDFSVNDINDYVWNFDLPQIGNTLNFSSDISGEFSTTLTVSSGSSDCDYTFNSPVIKVIELPVITKENIDIPVYENCNSRETITIELPGSTTDFTYQLLKDNEPWQNQMPQAENFFDDVPTGLNYSIIINNGVCTDTSAFFNITPANIRKPEIVITEMGNPVTNEICLGSEITFEIDDNDFTVMKWESSTGKSSGESPFSFVVSGSDELLVYLSYVDEISNCRANDTIELKVNQLPNPTVVLTVGDNPIINFEICEGEIFTLSTGDTMFVEYDWQLGDETSTEPMFTPVQNISSDLNYSLTVEDNKGCKSMEVTGLIKVEDKDDSAVQIQEEFPASTSSNHTTKFCKGSKAIYKYKSDDEYEFNIIPNGDNKIITHKNGDDKFIIIEWNTPAALTLKASGNTSTNRCTGNEISVIIDNEAPTGTIDRFGDSNTFIVNHNDETIDSFEWFILDSEDEDIYIPFGTMPTERIIDCESVVTEFNFDCDFSFDSRNTTKVLGVEIKSGQCSNIIFYGGQNILDAPMQESLINPLFYVHPNVNSGEFQLTLKSKNPQKKHQLSVYNISGQSIYNTAIQQTGSNFISIAKASPGVYLAVIKEGQQPIAQQKLIIY